ncbi:MAG TPA: PP2C family serine/threonine-protein phosphatase, partial [Bryobacteraceae bacterium]
MPAEYVFCEECGKPLGNVTLLPANEPGAPPCVRCGAPASAADEEGFCNECGFRRERPREHTEIVIDAAFASVTDQGKRHAHNEDSTAISGGAGARILIVCDGVSSSQDASSASSAAAAGALASLERSIANLDSDDRLRAAIRAAWHDVAEVPYTMSEGDPPSTTFVAALVAGNHITVAWAGDSRAYWLAGEHSRQLTIDDSWLNETVAEGKISYEEALHSDKAHAITKWLGADAGEPEPSIVSFECTEPGVLLLCTDGLWNYAEDPHKLEELAGSHDGGAIEMARRLVDFANEQGGRDNITAAVYLHTPVAAAPPEKIAEPQPEIAPVPTPEPAAAAEEPVTQSKRKWISLDSLWFIP